MLPTRKVGSAALAGALSVLLVFILNKNGVDITGEVASAITTVLGFGTGYLVSDQDADVSTGEHAA